MIFRETPLAGAYVIAPERRGDDRGYFARTWCTQTFAERGLKASLAQCSTSFNARRGTLRGLHFQAHPAAEAKLVRCTRGAIYDVIVDLREDSPTWGQWYAAELSANNGLMMYVPEDFAHGFQTLEDETEVFYQMSVPYAPALSRGIRWDDPTLAVRWPAAEPRIMSASDRMLPFLHNRAA